MVQEGILIALAVESLVDRDFEKEWDQLDIEKKKKIVLEGLYRGACTCPQDDSRISCPEMTIDGLVGDGEYNFINLLKRIAVHDPTGDGCVRELYLFFHPFVEREFALSDDAPDKERASVSSIVIQRNFYIVQTLTGILEAYHDVIPSHHPRARTSATLRTEERREARKTARAEASKGTYRADDSQIKEDATVGKNACASCYKMTDKRAELKKCSRCQLTWYCSRFNILRKSLGTANGTIGTLIKSCGKHHFEPEVLAPKSKGPKVFIGCPDSEPGFVRSPALWRQIKFLGEDDSQTQVYHASGEKNYKHTLSLDLGYLSDRQRIFLVARRRAMASGSLSAVALMLQMLQDQQRDSEYTTPEGIQRQLEREYRVDLSPAALARAPPFAPPTREEWEEEGLYCEQRMEKAQAWGLSKLEGIKHPKCCPEGCEHHLSRPRA
ncbi:hypothetical protein B0H19DRAFT_1060192 [Mycena capillaripes]|nr:hypothetical protein B0H19DRAFT_1060192 [Mycena capillaripes]